MPNLKGSSLRSGAGWAALFCGRETMLPAIKPAMPFLTNVLLEFILLALKWIAVSIKDDEAQIYHLSA